MPANQQAFAHAGQTHTHKLTSTASWAPRTQQSLLRARLQALYPLSKRQQAWLMNSSNCGAAQLTPSSRCIPAAAGDGTCGRPASGCSDVPGAGAKAGAKEVDRTPGCEVLLKPPAHGMHCHCLIWLPHLSEQSACRQLDKDEASAVRLSVPGQRSWHARRVGKQSEQRTACWWCKVPDTPHIPKQPETGTLLLCASSGVGGEDRSKACQNLAMLHRGSTDLAAPAQLLAWR